MRHQLWRNRDGLTLMLALDNDRQGRLNLPDDISRPEAAMIAAVLLLLTQGDRGVRPLEDIDTLDAVRRAATMLVGLDLTAARHG